MEASETIEKPAKRTYQKHKKGGKVSILHYENRQLKQKKNGSHYIYIRIIVKRQITYMRSLLDILDLTDFELKKDALQSHSSIKDLINIEKTLIENYVKRLNVFENENFSISEISDAHGEFSKAVERLFDTQKISLINGIVNRFLETSPIKESFYRLFKVHVFGSISKDDLTFNDFIIDRTDDFVNVFSLIIPELKNLHLIDKEIQLLNCIKTLEFEYGNYDKFKLEYESWR